MTGDSMTKLLALCSVATIALFTAQQAFADVADVASVRRPPRPVVAPPPPPPPPPVVAPAPAPGWQFWFGGEYVHMWRYTGDNRLLAMFDEAGTVPLAPTLFSDDSRFRGRDGFRVQGGFSWNGGLSAIEGSYLQLRTYRGRAATVLDPGDDMVATFIQTEDGFDEFEDVTQFTVTRKSSFYTFDINYRHLLGRFWNIRSDALIGFRYANFRDRINVDTIEQVGPPVEAGFATAGTSNRLYGLQFGLAMHRPLPEFIPGLGLKFDIKLALLANDARADHSANATNNVLATRVRRTDFATLIEGGLRLTYEPWPYLQLHAGYQFTWLGGVATAPNNLGSFYALSTSGSVLHHGPAVGLTVKFGAPDVAVADAAPFRRVAPAATGPAPWSFWLGGEYIYVNRVTRDNRDLLHFDDDGTPPLGPGLSSGQSDFRGRSGFHVFGGFSWNGGQSALEGGYWTVATFRGRVISAEDPSDDLQTVFLPNDDNDTFDAFIEVTRFRFTRKSSVHSFEVNYRERVGQYWGIHIDALVGFRFAHFSDRVSAESESGDACSDICGFYTGRVRNNLYGAQFGVAARRPLPELIPGLGLVWDVKLGLFANSARSNQFIVDEAAGLSLNTSVRRTVFAGMIESGLRVTYEPWQYLVLHAGYQFTWFTGVATAANNLGNFHTIGTSGSLLLHGPAVGATLRF